MPQEFQNSLPPQSAQAHTVALPDHKFAAVRRFGGFMDDSNISAEISALKKSLNATAWDTHSVDYPLLYTAAAYNSPFEHENRVNEVMLWFD
ncbi:SOUL heme-binding protein [Corchorus olitorius]|uniref:SOUL heme-binding protein n=1 Tax=Corchorus olitorius TaxID=93759 RepID=A0A1R3IR56_9ROSI|nr:SOUL heme-binding protein [Corchorus olitorius]